MRVAGAALIAAACLVAPMSSIEDPAGRRRALEWLCIGHFAMFLVASQFRALLPGGVVDAARLLLFAGVILLMYAWSTADGDDFFGIDRRSNRSITDVSGRAEGLRSRYEEQIRQAAAQEERHRLARDLHDSIKQQIFAIHALAATAQERAVTDPPGATSALERVRQSARDAMSEMDAMLDSLKASPLERRGLVEALRTQCDAVGFRTGAAVSFEVTGLPPDEAFAPGTHHDIFRIAQEALSNVARHARASNVSVTLAGTASGARLEVRDDGVGFGADGTGGGMGIASMRARAADAGATLTVTSAPGAGTVVTLLVPLLPSFVDLAPLYRRRALTWALFLAVMSAIVVWRLIARSDAIRFDSARDIGMYLPFMLVAAIGAARAWLASRSLRSGRRHA